MKLNSYLIVLLLALPTWSYAQSNINSKNDEPAKDSVARFSRIINDSAKPAFRGKIYSDLIGISDDQPNGLVQLEGYFHFPLFSNEYHLGKKKQASIVFFRNIILPDFTISKLEDDQRYLPVRYSFDGSLGEDSLVRNVNTLDLIQYANLTTNVKLNLFTIKKPFDKDVPSSPWKLSFDALMFHYRTGLRDSMRSSGSDFNVNTFAPGYQVKFELSPPNTRLELDAEYAHFWPHLFNDGYQQAQGTQLIDADLLPNEQYSYASQNPVDMLEFRIAVRSRKTVTAATRTPSLDANGNVREKDGKTLYDFDEESEKAKSDTRTFLRVSYHGNFFGEQRVRPNSFFQFQVGVEISLDAVMKGFAVKSD